MLRQQGLADDVDADVGQRLLGWLIDQRHRAGGGTRVINQCADIEAIGDAADGIEHRLAGEIETERADIDTMRRAHGGCGSFKRGGIAGEQNERDAVCRQLVRKGRTNAFGASGDDGPGAIAFAHVHRPPIAAQRSGTIQTYSV